MPRRSKAGRNGLRKSPEATPHRTCGTRMKLGLSGRPCLKNPYRREGSVVEVGKTPCRELQLLSL